MGREGVCLYACALVCVCVCACVRAFCHAYTFVLFFLDLGETPKLTDCCTGDTLFIIASSKQTVQKIEQMADEVEEEEGETDFSIVDEVVETLWQGSFAHPRSSSLILAHPRSSSLILAHPRSSSLILAHPH